MAMNVGASDDEEEAISTINTTPLVDVMLVLLIIFLITVPVVRNSIAVQLPKERNEIRETKPENIEISVDASDRIYWNDLRIQTTNALIERLKKIAVLVPQPEVQIRGDARGNYEGVGRVIYACQRAGIAKIAFVLEPPVRNGG
ncbi:MAG: biopolymer transporter ExbD [Betaproteobacteria bacterium]|nr:biopolymer transporter ExbD [Betaproteobacteria bacterium]MDE2004740.1 biopolymer transporter ExbD [Betaproteobacteria bacterium]MDE2209523.1 biopolymer transporter ExbD [Betaproteobacteria bacterium]MDE2358039.1 biopolymer transporter ExbD [Betaproteobacteria bacterium]